MDRLTPIIHLQTIELFSVQDQNEDVFHDNSECLLLSMSPEQQRGVSDFDKHLIWGQVFPGLRFNPKWEKSISIHHGSVYCHQKIEPLIAPFPPEIQANVNDNGISYCIQKKRANIFLLPEPRCLKITEKVSFNIASEASYVYILSVQKLIKKAKKVHFGEFLKT